MPAQERVGLDNQQGVTPALKAASECHEQAAIPSDQLGLLGLTVENDELLTQDRVLGDQVAATTNKITHHAAGEGFSRGLCPCLGGAFNPINEGLEPFLNVF